MYFKLFLSNNPMIKIAMATQPNPARNPAVAPHAVSVFGSFRNIARLKAIINDQTKDQPKILAMPDFSWPSVKPFSFIQAFPNRAGEYHNPPSKNVLSAATKTASQLIVEMSI